MFAAFMIVCGLEAGPKVVNGCGIAYSDNLFNERKVCELANDHVEQKMAGRLPKNAYVVDTYCIPVGEEV